jgi:mono/diheme cytochrome c family protein
VFSAGTDRKAETVVVPLCCAAANAAVRLANVNVRVWLARIFRMVVPLRFLRRVAAAPSRRRSGPDYNPGVFPRANTALLVTAAGALLAGCEPSRDEQIAEPRATVQQYCVGCHDDAERTADLSLQSLPLAEVAEHPAEWEKVVRKLRAGMMPPAAEPRPTADARLALASFVEGELDAAALANPNPGRTEPFHRLNRAEYRNAVRDLLDLDVDVAELLPADEASYGFDNIAGVLKLSPTLLERYLGAADKVSRVAIGTPSEFVNIDWFRVPDDRSQEQRLPGLPFGTRGGTLIEYTFPVDGDYTIAAELARDLNEQMPMYAEEQNLEIAIDGERVALFTLPAVPLTAPQTANNNPNAPAISQIVQRFSLSRDARAARNKADAEWRVRVPVDAGPHTVTATFLATTAALDEPARLPFLRPYPAGVNIPETRTGAN